VLTLSEGLGYEDHKNGKRNGARLLRFEKTNNFSVHDIILVDAPMFHFVMNTCTNGEAYNMAIRGGDEGGLDGVDVIGTNIWVHDVSISISFGSITSLTAYVDHGH
jgi:rhamnogalacturonan hydrolase